MIFSSLLILIVAMALPSFNKQLPPLLFLRITSIIFLYAGALSFNALYIQSIGSGIGIFNGLFHVTVVSQLLEVFLLIIGSLILIAWPLKTKLENTISEPITETNKSEDSQIQATIFKSDNTMNIMLGSSNTSRDYSLIVLFSTLGSSLLISSSDLVSMYLSIELQSFGLYVLATLYRDSESATSAGLKYFLLGSLSSCIILLGSGILYSFTGLTNFESIYSLLSVTDSNTILLGLSLGLILIFVGYLFKVSAAPLHNWSPDVYDDSPTIVTIWLTIMAKISIIILLLELHTQIGYIGGLSSLSISFEGYMEIFNNLNNLTKEIIEVGNGILFYPIEILLSNISTIDSSSTVLNIESDNINSNSIYVLKNLLLISSLLSLIIGTIVGLAQTRIKRLLAYSTISHIGFMLLALAINTEQSIDSLLFYLIQYSLTNLNTFLIIIALSYVIKNNRQKSRKINETLNSQIESAKNIFKLPILKNKNMTTDNLNKESNRTYTEITDIRYISELKGKFFSNPLLSLSLTVCLFSMAGTPPLIGFFSKQFVLYSAVQSGYYFMAIIAIIVSVISASYYLKIIRVLHSDTEQNIENENTENTTTYFTNLHSYLISVLTLTILLFVLKPSLILNSTQLLSLSLFNF